MQPLGQLVRQIEALLPRDSTLRHLLQSNRDTGTWLIALGYATEGEPEVVGLDFVEKMERAADAFVRLTAQPC